jgi:hypothetical protein
LHSLPLQPVPASGSEKEAGFAVITHRHLGMDVCIAGLLLLALLATLASDWRVVCIAVAGAVVFTAANGN